jgi:predicted DNA-binding protein (UPF0251 family)
MRPGRPRCPRRIETEPVVSYYKPQGVPLKELEVVLLSFEELEVVRLSDLEGMDQDEAAQRMGISRRALWEDLKKSRRKIVEALVKGKAIEIRGGNYIVENRWGYTCHGCHAKWDIPFRAVQPLQCPECGCSEIHRHPDDLCCNGHRADCMVNVVGKETKSMGDGA